MSDINFSVFTGRVTQEPSSRSFTNGDVVAHTTIASTKHIPQSDQSFKEYTAWIPIRCRNHLAKKLQSFPVGAKITVTGEIVTDQWEDSKGTKQSRNIISVDKLELVSLPKSKQNRQGSENIEDAPPSYFDDIPIPNY